MIQKKVVYNTHDALNIFATGHQTEDEPNLFNQLFKLVATVFFNNGGCFGKYYEAADSDNLEVVTEELVDENISLMSSLSMMPTSR